MASARLLLRSTRTTYISRSCKLCVARRLDTNVTLNSTFHDLLPARVETGSFKTTTGRRCYATLRHDVVRLRAEVDRRARVGFYKLSKIQAALKIEADKANAIYTEFLAQKSKYSHADNVGQLTKKYQCAIDDITDVALVTYKIPDLSDPEKRRQLPPSQHRPTSGLMLQGCAKAGDPLAIVHILTAVYTSSISSDAAAREIALMFPQSEISKYRTTLEALCSKSEKITHGPGCLTLKGLFLEKEGQRLKAREALQLAIKRSHLKLSPGAINPMQFPLIAPWNALGYLLASDTDPAVQVQAKTYFQLGAEKADDPLSYYELTNFVPRTDPDWLKFMSKAAASGHRQAAIKLAEFYQEFNENPQSLLESSGMQRALNWLIRWKSDSGATLARGWLQAASNLGHKPSMLQLADHCESSGDREGAFKYLERILESPTSAEQVEEWPQVVQQAQRRLINLKRLKSV